MIQVATTQYAIQSLDWDAYQHKIKALVQNAKTNGAHCLLLPEYAGIEIGKKNAQNDLALFEDIQPKLQAYKDFYQQLAQEYKIYIQPGSIPVLSTHSDRYFNRAYFFSPSGAIGFQDKIKLTASEKADGVIIGGSQQTLFETTIGKIGIAVCYDSEFPELVRQFTQAGAKLILVPSYTPTLTSFHRVHYACHARALENQCYVLLACAVQPVQFAELLEHPSGQAALYSPIDVGFPENGLITQGQKDEVLTLHASLSYEKIDWVRAQGQVHLFEDLQKGFPKNIDVTKL